MAEASTKKRKLGGNSKAHADPRKKFKKQAEYNSDDSDSSGVELPTASAASRTTPKKTLRVPTSSKLGKKGAPAPVSDSDPVSDDAQSDFSSAGAGSASEDGDDDQNGRDSQSQSSQTSDSDTDSIGTESSSHQARKKSKRHDPNAFSASMSAILGTNLTRSKRNDPVLARSKVAADASKTLADSKLSAKLERRLRDERKREKNRGRVVDVLTGDKKIIPSLSDDVLGLESGGGGEGVAAAEIAAQERGLRKTAQRGVVKLYNAIRQAQLKGEEGAKKAAEKGVIGMQKREEAAESMSREKFLEMVSCGGR